MLGGIQEEDEMNLTLALKSEFFEQVKSGQKTEEYRLCNPFWKKRIERRDYKKLILTKGYPRKTDTKRRLTFPYAGYTKKFVNHPYFCNEPVEVYAIKIKEEV